MSKFIFFYKGLGAVLILMALFLAACAQATVLPATAVVETQPAAAARAAGVRACLYVPGKSVPLPITAQMLNTPTPDPVPTAIPFTPRTVGAETTTKQIGLYTKIWNMVNDRYAYRDFHGLDWAATGKHYEALIRQGLTMEDFYRAMHEMVQQLGDDHSSYLSPDQVKMNDLTRQGKTDFVGIGAMFHLSEENGQPVFLIISTFPGSPAEVAGLKPHDTIIQVDDGPVLDESMTPRMIGPENTTVMITVRSPDQTPRKLKLVRQRILKDVDVDYCLVPGTRIGYLAVRNYINSNYPAQISAALRRMNAEGPLEGLILDNRSNPGGEGSTEKAILAMFAKGELGKAVGSGGQDLWNIQPLDIYGSQSVPMVAIVDEFSESGGEIIPGMLQITGRAKLVGMQTRGNTDALEIIPLEDGSQLYLATMVFQPAGGKAGQWEKKGVTPDVVIPARWNQYSEANDPMLAKAVELLQK